MAISLTQRSFSSGEISPSLHSRVDQSKYATALKTLRNAFVMRHGGAQSRSGTKFVGAIDGKARLIPFVFSNSQKYVLVFQDQKISVIKDGAIIVPTIVTEYLEADLPEIQVVQSADVMTIVHRNYPPSELKRLSDVSWTFETIDFKPDFDASFISFLTGTVGGAGSVVSRYVVTAISSVTGEESLPMFKDYGALASVPEITAITQANPAVVTQVAHGYTNGDLVSMQINSSMGMTELKGNIYKVSNAAANTYELEGIDSTSYVPFVWSLVASPLKSRALPISLKLTGAAATSGAPIVLDWQVAVPFAREYNVYKELNGVYGLIGISKNLTFNDTGLSPNTANVVPLPFNPFKVTGQYPSCVAYIQQRLYFGDTDLNPETVFGSKIGQYKNFTKNVPIQEDDYIQFTIAGRRVNRIKHIIDIGKMVILTESGEWTAEGNQNGVVTPSEVNLKQHSYIGSSSLSPLVVGGNALFVQARGSVVRDLAFDYQIDGYRGNDLTSFASHLVDKYSIVDWDYQQIPHSIVWMVRDDGTLLGLTHVREQQLLGWHRHDFGTDKAENVCVIPADTEDEVYVVVNRLINGSQVRYVERFATRKIEDIIDSVFLDSSLSYDGRSTDGSTMTLSGGTTWADTETLTLTASIAKFTIADIGNEIHFYDSDNKTLIRFKINAFTSTTVVTGKSNVTVPVALRAVASASWARAVDEISGLSHLEGRDVSVFADRFVDASPNNSDYNIQTVTAGAITLSKPRAVIHVGLPYTTDIETLDVDTAQGETLVNKQKNVSHISARVEETRGVFIGSKPPSDDSSDALEGLIEIKLRENESMNNANDLINGICDLNIQAHWNNNGRIFFRQVDPLPFTLLSVTGEGLFPFKGAS